MIWLRLAPECRIKDISWIRPGKVAKDWWNNTNVSGVDFLSGMNTDTYLYYIDFASQNNIEYIIIDEELERQKGVADGSAEPKKSIAAFGCLWSEERSGHHPMVKLANLIGSNSLNDISVTDAVMKYYADMGIKGFRSTSSIATTSKP